jgi:membrane peptidoglycan carboxypeptidase
MRWFPHRSRRGSEVLVAPWGRSHCDGAGAQKISSSFDSLREAPRFQQVAKLLLQPANAAASRGVTAKHEAVLALRLEHRFSKREVLALYLNLAACGNQIVGVERASRAYFGCPASMLTAAQASFLAGLPQRPTVFNPYRNRDAALARQRTVLLRMAEAGELPSDKLREALSERLTFTLESAPFAAPHFVEMVLAAEGDHPAAFTQEQQSTAGCRRDCGHHQSQRAP